MASIILFSIGLILALVEFRACRKRNEIEDLRVQIRKSLQDNTPMADGVALGAGAVGITLLDLYATAAHHADVLEILEQRFPHANGGNDVIDWFNKISTMMENSPNALETYVSCFKGQAAENMAVELLRDRGIAADLFETLNNETNDIVATLDNGREIAYSVKCGDTSYIKHCIENTDATHYIINSESYEELEQSGLLDYYNANGIEILNGTFSDELLTETAENAFEEIAEAGDVSDSIPYLALAMLGFKSYKNYKSYSEGKQTKHELTTNIVMDAARVGAAGIFANAGAEMGMYLGTMVAPGIGTVIGGGIGILAGAFMGSSVFEWGKETIKWGKIIHAQDYFGERFINHEDFVFAGLVVEKYMNTEEVARIKQEEYALLEGYEKELNPYSSVKASLPAVLTQEYYGVLEITEEKIKYAKKNLGKHMIDLCKQIAEKNVPKKAELWTRRLLGELVVCNSDCLAATVEEQNMIERYYEQKAIAGNYPYQFSEHANVVMERLVKQLYNSYNPSGEQKQDVRHIVMVLGIIVSVIAGVVVLIIQ